MELAELSNICLTHKINGKIFTKIQAERQKNTVEIDQFNFKTVFFICLGGYSPADQQ